MADQEETNALLREIRDLLERQEAKSADLLAESRAIYDEHYRRVKRLSTVRLFYATALICGLVAWAVLAN
jgi:hypothetical protein